MISCLRKLLLASASLCDHDLLVHNLLLKVAIAMQLSDIVSLHLPLKLRQVISALRVVVLEISRHIVRDWDG